MSYACPQTHRPITEPTLLWKVLRVYNRGSVGISRPSLVILVNYPPFFLLVTKSPKSCVMGEGQDGKKKNKEERDVYLEMLCHGFCLHSLQDISYMTTHLITSLHMGKRNSWNPTFLSRGHQPTTDPRALTCILLSQVLLCLWSCSARFKRSSSF